MSEAQQSLESEVTQKLPDLQVHRQGKQTISSMLPNERGSLTPRLIEHLSHPHNTDELLDAFDVIDATFSLPETVRAIDIFANSEHGRSGQQAYLTISSLETVLDRTRQRGQPYEVTPEQRQMLQRAFNAIEETIPGVR